jgi:hypothetical protein
MALCRDVCSNSQGGDYSFIATLIVRSGNASSNGWQFVMTFVQILKEVTTHLSLQLLFALVMHHPMAGTHDVCSNSEGGDYSFIVITIVRSGNASSNGWHFVVTFVQILKVTTHLSLQLLFALAMHHPATGTSS